MLQPYVTAPSLVLICAAHMAALAALVFVSLTPRTRQAGWRNVEPSAMHWVGFLGSWALSGLISWVWLFVGSAPADAETQMNWALGLAMVFGLSAAFSGFYLAARLRSALRWRGSRVRWRKSGRDCDQELQGVDSIRRSWTGALHIRFKDGHVLALDIQLRNATEFLAAISEALGRDAW